MKPTLVVLFIAVLAPAVAEAPPGFALWPASELKAYAQKLSPKINAQKVAVERLGEYGNHSVIVVHREASGESELHEEMADIFIVESGEGTLVVGGKIAGGKTTGPGEVRGTGIEGGETKKIGPGDIAHIPANTPHQVVLGPGQKITYAIVKVRR